MRNSEEERERETGRNRERRHRETVRNRETERS